MAKKKRNTNKKNNKLVVNEKKVKNKVENKSREVKSEKVDSDIFSLIKIILVIALIGGAVFGLTMLMDNMGVFDEGYIRPTRGETVISYETSIIGTIFGKKDKEYYVIFDEFGENANQYLYSVINRYATLEDALPFYTVDMSNGFNKDYLGEGSNPSASKASDIKIKGPTLMRIKNGKNVKYIEGVENIEKELLK